MGLVDQMVLAIALLFWCATVVTFVLYWTSAEKHFYFNITVWLLGAGGLLLVSAKGLNVTGTALSGMAVLASSLLCAFLFFYHALKINAAVNPEVYYYFICDQAVWLLCGMTAIFTLLPIEPPSNALFLAACTLTCALSALIHEAENGVKIFRFASVVITLIFTALAVIDPLLYFPYGYRSPEWLLKSVMKSIAFNAVWAVYPLLFFTYYLRKFGLVSEVDVNKLFTWIVCLVFGCALYRFPTTRELASKVPLFDTFVPGVAGATAFVLPGTVAVLKRETVRH